MEVIAIAFLLASGIWVYADASSIGIKRGVDSDMGPVSWAVCTMLLWILVFPVYLISRPKMKRSVESRKQGTVNAETQPAEPIPEKISNEETAAPDEKTCPMCAETVKAEARICRFCRHEFEEG